MLDCEPKLKRGLSDISPLFSSQKIDRPVVRAEMGSHIKILSICDFANSDSLSLNLTAAEKLFNKKLSCSVISIQRRINEKKLLKYPDKTDFLHLPLEMDEFSRIVERSVEPRFNGGTLQQLVLLAPDYSQPEHFPVLFELMDQFIVVVDASEESLREAYKLIKGTRNLNNRLQYFLMFQENAPRIANVFERFSQILSTRLRIEVTWIGYLRERNGSISMENINFEHLFLNEPTRLETPSKIALADFAFRARKAACQPA